MWSDEKYTAPANENLYIRLPGLCAFFSWKGGGGMLV